MPELTIDDVIQHNSQLPDDDETARKLAEVLAAARTYCGWHVNPVIEDDVKTLDGSGDPMLLLPTKRICYDETGDPILEVQEDGVTLDLADLELSQSGRILFKRFGVRWSGKFRAITVTMTHGFIDAEAADWRGVVLSAIDRLSLGAMTMSGANMVAGPYEIRPAGMSNAVSIFSPVEQAVLDAYTLKSV